MIGRPARNETGEYYFRYIDRIVDDDIVRVLETQRHEIPLWLRQVSEEQSRHRYAPDKWSMREVLGHINDTERLFLARAFWFARNFDTQLPSFDQEVCLAASNADEISWQSHIEEFEAIRLSTILFFRHLPEEAWMRSGIASDNPFTVRSLAYLAAGHALHHLAILQERYL